MLYWLARTIRLLAAWIDLAVFTLFMWFCAWLPENVRSGFYPRLYQRWNWCFVRAMNCELYIHQQNRLPLPKRYLLIANHPSALEDVGIPAAFPVRALGKAEAANWFIVGRIGRAAGTVFVKREDKNSRKAAGEAIEARLRAGDNIVVFPEGGCFGRRLKDRFHYGSFEIALNTNTPILPVFIHYEAQEDFEWLDETLPQKMWRIVKASNRRVNIYVFDAIDPARFNSREDLTAYVYKQYLKWQGRFLE